MRVCVRVRIGVRVRACVRVRVGVRVRVCVAACVSECASVGTRVRARACVRVRVRVGDVSNGAGEHIRTRFVAADVSAGEVC